MLIKSHYETVKDRTGNAADLKLMLFTVFPRTNARRERLPVLPVRIVRRTNSVTVTEGAVERIYRGKLDQYSAFVSPTSVIVPFVIESTGRIHSFARNFIDDKFQHYLKHPIRDLHARCAVIIQRYNAKMAANLRAKTAHLQ